MKPRRRVRPLFAVAFMAAVASLSAESIWEELPALPEGLAGQVVAATGDSVLVAGGTLWDDDRKVWRDAVLTLGPDDQSWRKVGSIPQPLGYAGFVGGDDGIWLLGGHNEEGALSDIVHVDQEGTCQVIASMPEAWRFSRGARSERGDYFVVRREQVDAGWEGAFLAVDVGSGQIRECAPLPNAAWVLPAVAATGGNIVVAGGATRVEAMGGIRNQSGILTFDPQQKVWHHRGDLPVALRGMGAVALGVGRVYLAGGYGDAKGFEDRAWIFDVKTGDLTEAPALPLAMMPELLRVGDAVYAIGGEDAPRRRSARVFRALISSLLKERENFN